MTALAGVELESPVSEPDALTTRPPPKPCRYYVLYYTASRAKKSEAKQQRVFKAKRDARLPEMLRRSVDCNSLTTAKDIA